MPNPDVEFYVGDDVTEPCRKAVYPSAIDQGQMGYHRHVESTTPATRRVLSTRPGGPRPLL